MIGQASPMRDLWKTNAVLTTADGSQIVRPGYVFSNTPYYVRFYTADGTAGDDRPYMALVGLKGPLAGKLFYMPLEDVEKRFGVLAADQRTRVLAGVPYVPLTNPDVTLETFTKAIDSTINLAEGAALEIKSAWYVTDAVKARAKGLFFGSPFGVHQRGGALEGYDKAILDLRIMRSIDMIGQAQLDELWQGVIEPVRDGVVAKANQVIASSGQWLIDFLSSMKWLAQATAMNLRSFAEKEWQKLEKFYGSILRHIAQKDEDIRKLEAVSPRTKDLDELIRQMKAAQAKSRVSLATLEAELRGLGVDVKAFKEGAALSGGPLALIGVAVAKIAAWWAVRTVIMKFIIVYILGRVTEALIFLLVMRVVQGVEDRIERTAEDRERLEEARNKLNAAGVGQIVTQSAQNDIDLLQKAAELSGDDPVLDSKITDAKADLAKMIHTMKKAGVEVPDPVSDAHAQDGKQTGMIVAAVAAMALIGLVLYFKRD